MGTSSKRWWPCRGNSVLKCVSLETAASAVSTPYYLGIDVGTGSARAGIFDPSGTLAGSGAHPIQTWKTREDFVEQSSDDIWAACCKATRGALADAGLTAENISGVGFDATCSLVALDGESRPVTVSPDGGDERNVIVWMDHRALGQTRRINATQHSVLQYVGGTMSPEMQPPKLLWLKEELPQSWARASRFFDLPDFLTYRATGSEVRSLCTTVCKWSYVAHEGGWDESFFRGVGLGDLVDEGYARIGRDIRPMGERLGGLSPIAAEELGLAAGTPVGVSIIDAHAGGLGLLGADLEEPSPALLEQRLALIGGTSSCHMTVSVDPRYIPGVWGPYKSAMVPDLWLTEGGQSATGALIDHTIFSHGRGAELLDGATGGAGSVYAQLNRRLDALAEGLPFPAALTEEVHVLPYFHGNRSPRANPELRGMISGLRLSDQLDGLAVQYLATIQAIAYGTRHIIEALNGAGYQIKTLIACGGDTKNAVFLRAHADVTGCRIVLPKEPEAVLLGSAMLGAVASGGYPSVLAAMQGMSAARTIIEPAGGKVAAYHERKYQVFHRMYADQEAYASLMGA